MTPDDVRTRLLALEQFGIKLGLDNIRTLVTAFDNPQASFVSIHIAGTNGKGSVSAMVERAVRDAGYRTGRYTSPHLDRLEERIALDGEPVDAGLFEQVTHDVFEAVDTLRARGALQAMPTFFEVTTAVAFEVFRRAAVNVGVVEVGLGGRFDATNVLTPSVTAITSIAMDHERHLGSSLASIAREKAGILKRGVPAVVGAVQDEPMSVIANVAEAEGAPIVYADDRLIRSVSMHAGKATISVTTPEREYTDVRLALDGDHQVANALVSIRTLEVLNGRGADLAASNIIAGLQEVSWPARLEWLKLPDNGEVLIDAAHNVAGATALARYLVQRGASPLPLVIAIMRDKDVDGMLQALLPIASRCVVTSVASARAMDAGELADHLRRLAPSLQVAIERDPESAVRRALASDRQAVAAGSIFLVGPLRARLLAAGAVSLHSR